MVVDEWGLLDSNSLIYSFVAICIIIERLPHKVTFLNALRLLRELLPVTTSDQSLRHSLRVVSSMDIEEELFLFLLGYHVIGILLQHLLVSRTY